MQVGAYEAPFKKVRLRGPYTGIAVVVRNEQFDRKLVVGDRQEFLNVPLNAAIPGDADRATPATADTGTDRDRQVPSHGSPSDVEGPLPLLHLERLIEAGHLGADTGYNQIIGRHHVG